MKSEVIGQVAEFIGPGNRGNSGARGRIFFHRSGEGNDSEHIAGVAGISVRPSKSCRPPPGRLCSEIWALSAGMCVNAKAIDACVVSEVPLSTGVLPPPTPAYLTGLAIVRRPCCDVSGPRPKATQKGPPARPVRFPQAQRDVASCSIVPPCAGVGGGGIGRPFAPMTKCFLG